MLRKKTVLLLLNIIWQLQTISGQNLNVPPNPCPQYFEYLGYNGNYIGKLTLNNVALGTTIIELHFSQRSSLQGYSGNLSLFQSEDATVANIRNGLPISYRVDFPTSSELPKLTQVSINGRVVCTGSEYFGSSSSISLQHTLRTSVRTSLVNAPPNVPNPLVFKTNPFFRTMDVQPVLRPAIVPQQPAVTQQAVAPPVQQRPVVQTRPPPSTAAICGREGPSGGLKPFVHGGEVLNRGQFPWLTAIYRKDPSNLKFLCGGSLVSSKTILTAAHCFKVSQITADRVVVFLGRYNLSSYTEPYVVREVRSLWVHPEYSSSKIPDADVALLIMDSPVSFTDYIRPICLWSESIETNLIIGSPGVVVGWGGDEDGNAITDVPKQVSANIVSYETCVSTEGFSKHTSARTLCAGERDGTGPCMGDSGGGLMMLRNGRWMLRGVVSVGSTTRMRCNLQEYVIYCDIAKHLPLVYENMQA